MENQINHLLELHYLNIQAKKVLKNEYSLNIYHLKILKYINDYSDKEVFTASEFKHVLEINQTMLTHVISYLHNLNYYKKERSKKDERKIIIIVETRHKTKITQLINRIERSMLNKLNTFNLNSKEHSLIDYIVKINSYISNIHNTINNNYKLNIDHFMILLFIQHAKQQPCTLKDIKNKFGWDLVKINKSIKTLVQLKYVNKKRDEHDERIVLVSIHKNVESEVKHMIEDIILQYKDNYGAQNLAMVK